MPSLNASFLAKIARVIDSEIAYERTVLQDLHPEADSLIAAITSLLTGGKRIRAASLYWAYLASGGKESPALLRAATAMEFFQAAALLHDDVMDASDTRRGKPSAHRALAAWHDTQDFHGDSERFGHAGAILAGDLCLTWTDRLYANSGLPTTEISRGRETFDLMRTQLMAGQYLDVLVAARGWENLDTAEKVQEALKVLRYKSAKYTIEHPLLIGAACAGADKQTMQHLSTYGIALGEAFQLRDDILGVIGDPEITGKPAGDDLREGKLTVLIALLHERSPQSFHTFMAKTFGQENLSNEDVARYQQQLQTTGAIAAVESMIKERAEQAQSALTKASRLVEPGRGALQELIELSTKRQA